jgi:hypothetical protein
MRRLPLLLRLLLLLRRLLLPLSCPEAGKMFDTNNGLVDGDAGDRHVRGCWF